MVDKISPKDNVTRAQYAFNAIAEKFNGQWGPVNELKRWDIGTPQYNAALKVYNKLKPDYEAAKLALDNANAAYQKATDATNAKNKKDSDAKKFNQNVINARNEYQKALDTGDATQIVATKAALDQAQTKVQDTVAIGTVSGDVKADIDNYILTTDPKTGAMYVVTATSTPKVPAGTPVYFVPISPIAIVPGKNSPNFAAIESIDEARNMIIAQQGGDFTKLKQQLLDSRYISQTEFNNNDWAAGLNASIVASTKFNFNRVKNSGGKEDFVSFNTFLGSTSLSGPKIAKTNTTTSQEFSTHSEAEAMLSKYYISTIGQLPTEAEQEQFWTDLHTAETASTQKVKNIRDSEGILTNQQVTGNILTKEDRLVIAAKVGLGTMKRLGGDVTAFKKLLDTGSSVSQNIRTLMTTANEQGIPMTELQAFKYVQDSMASGSSIAAQQERINRLAIALHGKENKMVADHLIAGGTYKDITDVYGGLKTQKTGVVVADSTKDADVQEAVRMGMTQSDFLRKQQGTKAWRETPEAHNVAADFAETVLKSFGFIG